MKFKYVSKNKMKITESANSDNKLYSVLMN